MSGTSPDFYHWQKIAHFSISEAACLMAGFDPRAMADVTDAHGDVLTLEDEQNQIQSAIDVGEIRVMQGDHPLIKETRLLKEGWLIWLHKIGMKELALKLSYFPTEETSKLLESSADSEESTEDIAIRENKEPFLQNGPNNRKLVEKWVAWHAHETAMTTDTIANIVEDIKKLADRNNYQSERKKLTKASITRMIPAGITGGRTKNKGRSKNLPSITFGGGESKTKA